MADYNLQYQDTYIDALLATANELKTAGYIYKGVATPSTNPGTPTERVAYLASEPGTYINFGGIVIASGLYSLTYAGDTWTGTQMQAGSDIEVLQTTGQSTSDVMSQKAVTDSLVGSTISYDNSQSGLASNNVQGALDDIGKWNVSQRSNFDFMLYAFNGTKITTLSGYKGFVLKVKAGEVYWFDKALTNYSFFVNSPANNSTTSSWHAGILAGTAAVVTDNTANYMYVTVPSSYTDIIVYKREDVQAEIEDVRDNISYSRSLSNFSPYGFNGTKITTLSGYKGFILEVKEGEVYSFNQPLTNYAFFVNIPANNSTASSWHTAIYANTKVVVTDASARYMYVTVANSVSEIEITKYGGYDIRIASIENYLDSVKDVLPTVTPISSFSSYAFNGTKITTLSGYYGFILEVNYGEIYWFDKAVQNYAFFVNAPVLNSTPISWHIGILAGTKAVVTEPNANYMFVTIMTNVDSINVNKGNQYDIDIELLKKVTNKRVMAGSATNIPIVVLIYDDATDNDHLLIEKCDARGLNATLAIPYDISPSYESSLITWLNNGHGIIGHSNTPPGMDDSNDAALYEEMEKLLTKINTLGQSCHGFAYYGSTTAEYPHNRRILSKYWDYCWKYHRGKPVNTPSTDVYDLDRGSTDYLNYIDGYKQLILDNLGKNCVIAFGGHMTRTGTGTSQYCTMAYFEQFLDMLQWFVDNNLVVSMNAEDAMKEYFKRTNNACIVKASSLYNPVVGQQKMNGSSILTCTNAGTCAYYQMAISGTPSSGQIKLSIDGYNGSQTITINTTSGQTINDIVNAFVNSVYRRYTVRKVSDGIVGLFCDVVGVANTPSITSNTSGLTIMISQIVEGVDSVWV